MANTRDDFTSRTKSDLALRSSYLCSLCKCSTVGPSDEASNAVTMVGVAAHIAAAAPGAGARRYDPAMTAAERSHIDNGIWLCATCSTLIDRDESRYTVEHLQGLKKRHESSRRIHGNGGVDAEDIIGIGPSLIVVGSVLSSGPNGTRVRISHFLQGTIRDLWSLTSDFHKWPSERRYVLLNELGYGGILGEMPNIERTSEGYEIQFTFMPETPRRDAKVIKTMCRETGRMLEGIDANVQIVESVLGMAYGTWFAGLDRGSDISDLYWRYLASPWFGGLVAMEMIRLSSIPSKARLQSEVTMPFPCVKRINHIEVPSFDLTDHRLAIYADLELEGLGNWAGRLSVFISTPEQLLMDRERAAEMGRLIEPTQKGTVVPVEVEDQKLKALLKKLR